MIKSGFKVFLLFFVLGLIIYSNSLNNKFIIDDYAFIGNPVLSSTKFMLSEWNPYREESLGVIDPDTNLQYYRPMTHMVYDFCYGTFKNNFWQYHLFNLFFFVLASSLIYLFVLQLSGNSYLAFLAGLFFLIHPINGIVVNYISASVFALQVIFMLGACILLLAALERNNNRWLYRLSLLSTFLSLFWHESGILIPVYISALVMILRHDSFRSKILYLCPYFLIVGVLMLFRGTFVSTDTHVLNQVNYFHLTVGQYLASFSKVIIWYISRLFYPHGIVMQWFTPIVRHHLFIDIAELILLGVIFLILFFRFSKERILQFSFVWLLIGFVPLSLACLLKLFNGFSIEPHWFIFSSIGFYILAAYLCVAVFRRNEGFGYLIVLILVLSWSILTHRDNTLWKDQKTYALYWLHEVPHLRVAQCALGNSYYKEGLNQEAKKYYTMALRGYSFDEDVYNDLGVIDFQEGNYREAESNYKKVIGLNQHSASAYSNLGVIYLKEGHLELSKTFFRQALANNPMMIPARLGLVQALIDGKEYDQAIAQCLIHLSVVNNDPDILMMLINVYIAKKDTVHIKKYVNQIIDTQTDQRVLINLAANLVQNNYLQLAFDTLTRTMQPTDSSQVYLALSLLLVNSGKFNEAINVSTLGTTADIPNNQFMGYINKFKGLRS